MVDYRDSNHINVKVMDDDHAVQVIVDSQHLVENWGDGAASWWYYVPGRSSWGGSRPAGCGVTISWL